MPESAQTRQLRMQRMIREAHERQMAADERERKTKSFLRGVGIAALAAGVRQRGGLAQSLPPKVLTGIRREKPASVGLLTPKHTE